MIAVDAAIFTGVQKLVGINPVIDLLGIFCASVLIWLEAGAAVVFWLMDRRRRFLEFMTAPVTALLAWLMSDVIGKIYFRPRPFAVLETAKLLINKSPLDKSFPSDHATIAFAIAVSIFLVDRRWGYPLLAVATVIALARIFVGVHYLTDIAAGAVLGSVCALAIHRLIHWFLHTRHGRT